MNKYIVELTDKQIEKIADLIGIEWFSVNELKEDDDLVEDFIEIILDNY